MDAIIGIDRALFYIINVHLATPLLDYLMPFVTSESNFIGVAILGWVVLIIMGRGKDRKTLILLLFVILVSDFFSSILKELIQRVRPCAGLENIRLLVGCSGSYSFPSSHGTNIFAAMVWLSLHYRRFIPLFLTVALIISYSRVYVGVHYPLDVIGGACFGTSIAFLFVLAEERFLPSLIHYCKYLKVSD